MASKLIDTTSGLEIVAPTLAQMVTYSPTPFVLSDGKHVAFANGGSLRSPRADRSRTSTQLQRRRCFSNPRDLVTR